MQSRPVAMAVAEQFKANIIIMRVIDMIWGQLFFLL